jgi:hypothetical protein
MTTHRESTWDPTARRVVHAPTVPWKPARVTFIVAQFSGRCHWCGFTVEKGESCAYYPNERELAHDRCHRECS